ncbi:MAG: PAS domain S-box protein [Nitrospirae bacterium]|nr:MAG: PAS domain S-box protein [Nitrospirota bacterium]
MNENKDKTTKRKRVLFIFVWGYILLTLSLLIATYYISDLKRRYFIVADVIHEVQIEVFKAYSALNEKNLDKNVVQRHLTNSSRLINALLRGGRSLHGFLINPLRDEFLLDEIKQLKMLNNEINKIVEDIFKNKDGIDSSAIKPVIAEFINRAWMVDSKVEAMQFENDQLSRRIIYVVIAAWVFLGGIFLYILRMFFKKEEELLHNISRQFKFLETLMETVPAPIFYKDREGRYLGCNRAFEEFTGLSREEIKGKTVFEVAPEGLARKYYEKDRELYENPGFQRYQFTVKDRDGECREVIFFKSTIMNDEKGVDGIVGVILDITERVEAEKSLRLLKEELDLRVRERTQALKEEIERRKQIEQDLLKEKDQVTQIAKQMDTLLEAIPDHIMLISKDFRLKWSNRQAYSEAIRGKESGSEQFCYKLIHNRETPCFDCPVQTALKENVPTVKEIKNKHGKTLRLRAYPLVSDEGSKEVLIIATDITEIVKLQEEALRTRNLSSLGELAAGVAHEINNPINGIMNYAQIILNRLGGETREGELARRIIKESDRVSSIVTALLSFGRQSGTIRTKENLRKILDAPLTLLENQLRSNRIRLEIDIPDNLPMLFVDRSKMEQVFLNLLINARHALNGKKPDKDRTIRITAGSNGTHVIVKVWDNGCGIPENKLNKIWDPFYTTKPVGEGIGLGLSIVHGIISEFGGSIEIKSKEGEYTEVVIGLPLGEGDVG